jgi:hypothetical protein
MLWRMAVEPPCQRIGIMLACLDDRLGPMRSARIPGRHRGRTRNPCRTPAALTHCTAPLGCTRKTKPGAERTETQRGAVRRISGSAPRRSAIGNWQDAAEIAEIAGRRGCRRSANREYCPAVANVLAASVFSPNGFKGLASPQGSSSGWAPGVIALSHLRNRTVTCGS